MSSSIIPSWAKKNFEESLLSWITFTPDDEDLAFNHFSHFINSTIVQKNFSKPHEFAWEITRRCNLNCKHCFVFDSIRALNNEDLDTNICFNIIDQLKELGIFRIIYSGGEPFIREDFIRIIEYTKKKNISVVIHSNSLLIDNHTVKYLDRILHPLLDIVQISLDGATESTHEELRGKGTYYRTLAVLEKLSQTNITLRVNFTPTRDNILELPDTFRLSNKLKIDYFDISDFIELKNKRCQEPDFFTLVKAVSEIISLSKKSKTKFTRRIDLKKLYRISTDFDNITAHLGSNERFYSKFKCSGSFRSMAMNSEGNVYLCIPASYCEGDLFVLGNILNNGLDDIWENRVNNIIFQGRNPKELNCSSTSCPYLNHCQGGCIAKTYYYKDNINEADPRCARFQSYKKSD